MNHGISKDKLSPELIAAMRTDPNLRAIADALEKEMLDTPTQRAMDEYVTTYPEVKTMKEKARKLSVVDDCVLILGQTGTGKELIAKILHGDRKGQFVPVNCGAIPETLIESELFGFKKGAFTGADRDRLGFFEQAKDGTLFLDEIGDMPLPAQVKLLRVIQERKIRRVGDSEERLVNCRIIAATHQPIKNYVTAGIFRADLYHRLSTFTLHTVELRQRSFDVPLIVKHLDKENKIKDIDKFCSFITPDMLDGNVRSLQQFVRRYYVLNEFPRKD